MEGGNLNGSMLIGHATRRHFHTGMDCRRGVGCDTIVYLEVVRGTMRSTIYNVRLTRSEDTHYVCLRRKFARYTDKQYGKKGPMIHPRLGYKYIHEPAAYSVHPTLSLPIVSLRLHSSHDPTLPYIALHCLALRCVALS